MRTSPTPERTEAWKDSAHAYVFLVAAPEIHSRLSRGYYIGKEGEKRPLFEYLTGAHEAGDQSEELKLEKSKINLLSRLNAFGDKVHPPKDGMYAVQWGQALSFALLAVEKAAKSAIEANKRLIKAIQEASQSNPSEHLNIDSEERYRIEELGWSLALAVRQLHMLVRRKFGYTPHIEKYLLYLKHRDGLQSSGILGEDEAPENN